MIFPGLQATCARCGRPFTWRSDHRGQVFAIDDEPIAGGPLQLDGDAAFTEGAGHVAVDGYVYHGRVCDVLHRADPPGSRDREEG